MRNFELLTADQIECRISTVTEKGCSLLLYKTARTDYEMLDKHVTMFGWRNDYKEIDGKMYCGIAIKDNNTGEWIWKWNVGTESNQDAEKGQASDAMKRAGFCWGIGTELYSAPFIWIPAEYLMKLKFIEKSGKWVCKDTFTVKEIGYDEQENINNLVIINQDKNIVFPSYRSRAPKVEESNPYVPTKAEQRPVQQPVGTISSKCIECGKIVTLAEKAYSEKSYGYCLCRDCQKKYARK